MGDQYAYNGQLNPGNLMPQPSYGPTGAADFDMSVYGDLDPHHHHGSDDASSLITHSNTDLGMDLGLADPATVMSRYENTIQYLRALSQVRKAPFVSQPALPPVWTQNRAWLSEALDYVSEAAALGMRNGESLTENGLVMSVVLDGRTIGDRRQKGYLDGEAMICEIGVGCSKSEYPRVFDAWRKSMAKESCIVVVVGREWCESRLLPWPRNAQYLVLDSFHCVDVWMEKRNKGAEIGMAKLERIELETPCWWNVGKEGLPPALPTEQRASWTGGYEASFSRLSAQTVCQVCQKPSPMIYANLWICVNHHCGNFWKEGLEPPRREDGAMVARKIPDDMKFAKPFLFSRKQIFGGRCPTWELRPNLSKALNAWRGGTTVMGTVSMRTLWRGAVCPQCYAIVPAKKWCFWECDCRKWFCEFDIGSMPLQAVVPTTFTSWHGHALFEPELPAEFGGQRKS